LLIIISTGATCVSNATARESRPVNLAVFLARESRPINLAESALKHKNSLVGCSGYESISHARAGALS
jgi:hypothetical protein